MCRIHLHRLEVWWTMTTIASLQEASSMICSQWHERSVARFSVSHSSLSLSSLLLIHTCLLTVQYKSSDDSICVLFRLCRHKNRLFMSLKQQKQSEKKGVMQSDQKKGPIDSLGTSQEKNLTKDKREGREGRKCTTMILRGYGFLGMMMTRP